MSTAEPATRAVSRAEKFAIRRLPSNAPTAMKVLLLAGRPTKPKLPAERFALFPAAATIRLPAFRARWPAVS